MQRPYLGVAGGSAARSCTAAAGALAGGGAVVTVAALSPGNLAFAVQILVCVPALLISLLILIVTLVVLQALTQWLGLRFEQAAAADVLLLQWSKACLASIV